MISASKAIFECSAKKHCFAIFAAGNVDLALLYIRATEKGHTPFGSSYWITIYDTTHPYQL